MMSSSSWDLKKVLKRQASVIEDELDKTFEENENRKRAWFGKDGSVVTDAKGN